MEPNTSRPYIRNLRLMFLARRRLAQAAGGVVFLVSARLATAAAEAPAPSSGKKTLHFLRHGQAQHNPRAEAARAAGCSFDDFLRLMKEDDAFDALPASCCVKSSRLHGLSRCMRTCLGLGSRLGVELGSGLSSTGSLHYACTISMIVYMHMSHA